MKCQISKIQVSNFKDSSFKFQRFRFQISKIQVSLTVTPSVVYKMVSPKLKVRKASRENKIFLLLSYCRHFIYWNYLYRLLLKNWGQFSVWMSSPLSATIFSLLKKIIFFSFTTLPVPLSVKVPGGSSFLLICFIQ